MYLERHTRSKAVITGLVIGCLLVAVVPSLAQGDLGQGHRFLSLAFPDLSVENYLFEDNSIENLERSSEMPPPRIVEEILGGVLGGAIVGVVGAGVGYLIGAASKEGDSEDWNVLPAEGLGMAIGAGAGYVLGSAVGVYQVGDNEKETGNSGAALLGSIAGSFLGGFLTMNLGPVGGVAALLGSPIGATVGFNMTRRYKPPPPSEDGFINFKDGRMYLATPKIYLQPDPLDKRILVHNLHLLKLSF